MTRHYLFSFNFEKGTQRNYIINFLKENKIDYVFDKEELFADLFGENEYFKLECVNVCNNNFEVYYQPNNKVENTLGRLYPLVAKVLKIETPIHIVKITFKNGDVITTTINGCSDKVIDYYFNNLFNVGNKTDDIQKVSKVEFLK